MTMLHPRHGSALLVINYWISVFSVVGDSFREGSEVSGGMQELLKSESRLIRIIGLNLY